MSSWRKQKSISFQVQRRKKENKTLTWAYFEFHRMSSLIYKNPTIKLMIVYDNRIVYFRLWRNSQKSSEAMCRFICTGKYYRFLYLKRLPRAASNCFLCIFATTFAPQANTSYTRVMHSHISITYATVLWRLCRMIWLSLYWVSVL